MAHFEQWAGFKGKEWVNSVDVRSFIQENYTPYEGDESFLEGPTEATNTLWGKLQELQKEERAKGGVLDMETEVVSGLTAYGPGYISEETRKKVTQAMQEMNYQPNELARSLAKAHSNTIGVIVPHISHPFFSKMISALESAAAKRGYKILLCNSKDQPEKETEYLDMFISNRVTGVVMASRDVQIEKFHDLKIPIVNFEREENTEAITIQCDNEQGGALAASHLADCGCRHLLHFGGIVGRDMPADRRADGFLRVCRERGIEGEVLLSDRLSYGSMHYESYIEKGLLEHPETDGIFASSDLIAAQVLQCLYAMGKRVPEDIKVVGFDDTVIAGITTPSITTIHQPIEEMSELSIAYIDRRRKGEMVPNVTTMPVSLVVRGSA